MTCDKCGRKNRNDANFCDRCGQSVLHISGRDRAVGDISTIPAATPPKIDESVTQEQLSSILGGRYELKEMLGRGGMGVVYRAFDQQLGMEVAIKFLLDRFVNDFAAVASLKREAKAAMRLAHPNILRLYNFEDRPEAKYLLMEYVDGESLASIASRKPKRCFSEQEVKNLVSEVCEGLRYAHDEGIVHRDIKPSNILITRSGRVKLADFGVAHFRETSSSQVSLGGGTPVYMSPEQIADIGLDGRADMYSLGITMYEMLSGAPPFIGDDVRHCHLHVIPKPIKGVSDWMNTVVLKCLRKEPEGRWCNMEELRDILKGKKTIGVTMQGVYQPEWLRARDQDKMVSPKKKSQARAGDDDITPPEPRRLPVYKAPPVRSSGVRQRVERIEKHSGLAGSSSEPARSRAMFGAPAGIAAGAMLIAISRGSPWSISDDLLFQFSWLVYGALLGIAFGVPQRGTAKRLLTLTLGLAGGIAAVILMKSLMGLPAFAGLSQINYAMPCAVTVGAFIGVSDGIYGKSLAFSARGLLMGALGGVLAGALFLGARYLLSEHWPPLLNWLFIGGSLGFFPGMCLDLMKKPLGPGVTKPLRSVA